MSLAGLTAEWRSCEACGARPYCRGPVVGWQMEVGEVYGVPLVLVIGTAPSRIDDARERPFGDAAGRLLQESILLPAGVRNAYLTTLVACRGSTSEPSSTEIAACARRLSDLAETLAPSAVLFTSKLAERECARAAWAVGLPAVGIVDPSLLIERGHPNEGTRRSISVQIAKVVRLLERASKPRRSNNTSLRGVKAPRGGVEVCAHAFTPSGFWRGPTGALTSFEACQRCGLLSKTE